MKAQRLFLSIILVLALLGTLSGLAQVALAAPSTTLVINEIHYNPTGVETDGEWVELYVASSPGDLDGWTLTDQNSHTYTFPPLTPTTGEYIVVHTGTGTNDLAGPIYHLYWGYAGSGGYWNDGGDDVLLTDATDPVDYVAYGSGSGIDSPPGSLSWSGTNPSSSEGVSISLKNNGVDGDSGDGWEESGTTVTIGPASVGSNNNPPYNPSLELSLDSRLPDNATDVYVRIFNNLNETNDASLIINVPSGFQVGEPSGVPAGTLVGTGYSEQDPTHTLDVKTTGTQNTWNVYSSIYGPTSPIGQIVIVPNTSLTYTFLANAANGMLLNNYEITWNMTFFGRIAQGELCRTPLAESTYTFNYIFTSEIGQVKNGSVDVTIERPDEVWVNDDYTGNDNDGGHDWNYDAFAHVQDGVNAVNPGGTVHVYPGTYDSRYFECPWAPSCSCSDNYAPALIVYKDGLTIRAEDPNPANTVIQSTHTCWSNAIAVENSTNGGLTGIGGWAPNAAVIVANDVTIEGFTFHRPYNCSHDIYECFWNTAGVFIGSKGAGYPDFLGHADGATVRNNVFSDVWHAVYIWHSDHNAILSNTVEALGSTTNHWAAIESYDGYNDEQIGYGNLSNYNTICYNTLADKGIGVGAWPPDTWTDNTGDVLCHNTATYIGTYYSQGLKLFGCNETPSGDPLAPWTYNASDWANITGITYTGDTDAVADPGTGVAVVTLSAQLSYSGDDGSGIPVTFTVDTTEYPVTTGTGGVAETTVELTPGTYDITVSVAVCDACEFSDSASLTVRPPGPCIDLEKTGPETAEVGETITYHFKVINCGTTPLKGGAHVYDPLFGSGSLWDGDMAPGDVITFTRDYTVQAGDVPTLTNTARAIGRPPGMAEVSDEDTWEISVSWPSCASTVYVDDNYCDGCPNDGHYWGYNAFATIQDGIDGVCEGGTVYVATGMYNESVTINKDNLTVLGASGSRPAITSGLKLDTDLSGLTFKNFRVTGTVPGQNSVVRMYGAITDLTIDNCVFDGENTSGRHGFSGGQLEGDVTVTNSEFKNILGWALFESRSGSGGDGSAMGTVTFANNNIHHSNGSVVFRGLSTDRTDVVNAYGNTWENIGGNGGETGQHWAALEVNRAVEVNVYGNTVKNVSLGQWGEGQALQLWDIDTVDVHGNSFTSNAQGIFIYGGSGAFAVPGGSIHCNVIEGNAEYGTKVDATATSGPLNAEENWWGDVSGPSGDGPGTGDAVYGNVDYDPWSTFTPPCAPHPCVKIEKTGPETAHVGETITYHFKVTNCGNTPLYGGAHVYDPLFGSGSIWDRDMEPGDVFSFDKTYTVKSTDPDPLKNTATAVGNPPGAPSVTDKASWTVDIIPTTGLNLTLDPEAITAGESVTCQATASDDYGYTWDVTTQAAFSIQTEAGGSWDDNVYISQKADTWRVMVEFDGQTATSNLTVEPNVPAQLILSAEPTTIPADGESTAVITAAVSDGWDNLVADGTPVTFSTTAGTLDTDTAPTEDGLATAILTSDPLGGVAVVTVTAGEVQDIIEIGFEVTASEHRIYLPLIWGD